MHGWWSCFADVLGFSKSCHRAKKRQRPRSRGFDTSEDSVMVFSTVFKQDKATEAEAFLKAFTFFMFCTQRSSLKKTSIQPLLGLTPK